MASTVAFRTSTEVSYHAATKASAPHGPHAAKYSSQATLTRKPKQASSGKWVPVAHKASEQSLSDASDSERSAHTDDPFFHSTDADTSARSSVRSGDDLSSTASCSDSDFGDSALQCQASSAALVQVYPAALLVQLRAALCGVWASAPADSVQQPLGYSTKEEAELATLGLVTEASPSGGGCSWRRPCAASPAEQGEPREEQSFGINAASWRQQAQALPLSSETSWVAKMQQRRQADKASDDEQVARSARSILNKLTLERFDSLYEQLAGCGVRTAAHISILMREVHEKATGQHHFINMYADLCVRLEQDPRTTLAVEAQQNGFRRLLLNECQTAFERLLEPRVSAPEDEEARVLRKQRALGNVKFVGQLIVRGMLSSKLLITCSEELLSKSQACDDALESLAALLTVACPKFDTQAWLHKVNLDAIFSRIAKLSASREVPARKRFLLRDVLELREARWPEDAHAAAKAARAPEPMRLDEVRDSRQQPGVERSGSASWATPTPSSAAASPAWAPATRTSLRADAVEFTPTRSALRADAVVFTPGEAATKMSPPSTPSTASPASSVPASPMSKPAAARAEVLSPPKLPEPCEPFNPREFHRELSAVMKDLGMDRNVAAAVRKIRAQNVPQTHQAKEFADILTRAAEESRGPVRRSAFAFAAGLAAATDSAFDRKECIAGVGTFFSEVYEDLCEEVPRLAIIASAELLPTLCSVLPEAQLRALLPEEVAAQAM